MTSATTRTSVSILTRPEGRVQRDQVFGVADAIQVSILTRPEGRVQQQGIGFPAASRAFQSSPVPKDGCN